MILLSTRLQGFNGEPQREIDALLDVGGEIRLRMSERVAMVGSNDAGHIVGAQVGILGSAPVYSVALDSGGVVVCGVSQLARELCNQVRVLPVVDMRVSLKVPAGDGDPVALAQAKRPAKAVGAPRKSPAAKRKPRT